MSLNLSREAVEDLSQEEEVHVQLLFGSLLAQKNLKLSLKGLPSDW